MRDISPTPNIAVTVGGQHGEFDGLKLIEFTNWKRRGGIGRNATFMSVQNRLRDLVLETFAEYEEGAALSSSSS